MKVLYLSSYHPVFEYNHLTTLNDLGHTWFSTGVYLNPKKRLNIEHLRLRPAFKLNPDLNTLEHFLSLNTNYFNEFHNLTYPVVTLSKDFVDRFDMIVACCTQSLFKNWDCIKHKPLFLITCGNTHSLEAKLKPYVERGIHIVRGSTQELKIKDCNEGSIIPCFVDENIYKDWNGSGDYVLSFQSHFQQRRSTVPVQTYLKVVDSFKTKVYGAYPSGLKDPLVLGTANWPKQLEEYKNCGVYFCISNGSAPVTFNFLEALVLGSPVVCFGPKIGGSTMINKGLPSMYDQHNIIENEVDGFYSDDITKLREYINYLLDNKNTATTIGTAGRKKGISLYSRKVVRDKWEQLFKQKL